jgi:hypothetical protein
VTKGESRLAFYINNRLATPDEMEQHIEMIRQMERELQERKRP